MLWKVEQLLTVETRTYFLAVSFSVLVSRFHFPIVQKLFHNLIGSVLVSLACWTLPETTSITRNSSLWLLNLGNVFLFFSQFGPRFCHSQRIPDRIEQKKRWMDHRMNDQKSKRKRQRILIIPRFLGIHPMVSSVSSSFSFFNCGSDIWEVS